MSEKLRRRGEAKPKVLAVLWKSPEAEEEEGEADVLRDGQTGMSGLVQLI